MRKFTLCMLACCAFAASSYAQEDLVNREKYPDYVDPREVYAPEPRLMKYVPVKGESQKRMAMRKAAAEKLPEYWNNAESKYFPPVFNQDGGSCGSASRICYMFTHEINALRDVDGNLPENQYPSHFVWLHTSGNDGKDQFVEYIGVPNSVVYGGRTYSSLFGYQEETQNNFGWMTGYDKWMNAIGNRMLRPTYNPLTVQSEEGRQAAKAWLYNHAGDTDFKAGGLIGLGVASGGQWYRIPKTEANDAAGVTNMYYVHRWGEQTDHAVTMVGWDDRIEFDLDGNGIAGEVEKDEKGAWIIVNSWGDWCNKGFIYCPYKYAGPMSNQETGEIIGGYWTGELYHARKNFRPLRVIKVKMDYSHRSELLLQVGISSDLNATEPESITDLHHFRYAGDGKNGSSDPAPAVPMLGKWADGWHEEPMEFCYDLTDFSAKFDKNKALKYFFIVTRKKDTNRGQGNVYEASLVDMEYDTEGVETPFDLGGEKFHITQEGRQLMISSVVYGSGYEPVTNLSASAGVLTWNAPKPSSYNVASYNVYKDGAKIGNTEALTYEAGDAKEYAVTAVYEDGTESAQVSCNATVMQNDVAVSLENAGFVIPNVFSNHYTNCTLEFFVRPSQFYNWNCSAGPGWGTYMHHFNADGSFSCGWGANARINSSTKFTLESWQHVAIVVEGGNMTVYRAGTKIGSISTTSYSGLGGFGDLVFNYSASNSWQNAMYDEIRIWDHARTETQIKGSTVRTIRQEFYGDVMPQGLLAYYKGDVFMGENGAYYMRDCVGGNHAIIYNTSTYPEVESTNALSKTALKASIAVNVPEKVYAGVPVTLSATRSESINKVWWTIPSCEMNEVPVLSPTVTFKEVGKHTVTVYGAAYNGTTKSEEIEVEVVAAPAIDANFTMSANVLPCGEHLSMNADKYYDACKYEWVMTGANVETVYGAKAGATYDLSGEYTITLKVTSSDGQTAESSQTVNVTSVAPLAGFNVSETVVLKETPITLTSTTRYGATSFEWQLNGQAQNTTITPGLEIQSWTPKYPGRYDIGLTASNSVGSNSITKEKVLIVTNDDSQNGLNFSQPNAKVTVPFPARLQRFTVDFWANPTSLSNYCWGMGDSESTFLIKVGADGTMYLSLNGSTVKSASGFVQTGSWNHYAVVREVGGVICFYRNGERITRLTGANRSAVEGLTSIALGVDEMPMNGGIDEFRIWNSALNNFDDICNEHMDNPAAYVESDELFVYYDFNQSGGDVIDRSGNNNTGVRSGFGPDGDAWGLSRGVFSLYFGEKLADEVVTSVDEVLQDGSSTGSGVYTISGQYVGKSIKGLPAGLYIVDGKKVAIK